MMQKLAWVFCIVFVALGVLGFVPTATPEGLLLSIFSVDVMLSVIYLVSGAVAGFVAWKNAANARLYFKVFGVVYAIFTVAGLLQGDTVLGLFAVNMATNLLHLVMAAIALWAGFGSKESAPIPSAH